MGSRTHLDIMGTLGRTFKMIRTSVILLLVTVLLPEIFCGDSSQDLASELGDEFNDVLEKLGITKESLGEINTKNKVTEFVANMQNMIKEMSEDQQASIKTKATEFFAKIQNKFNPDQQASSSGDQQASSSGERGMSLYCGVLLALVIFFK